MSVALVFPPTWSLTTGSPHVALPLLSAFLRANGIAVHQFDLNWEMTTRVTPALGRETAIQACINPTLANMNAPYFEAEARLMSIASPFGATWNAQLGIEYASISHFASADVFAAAHMESPFTDYYLSDFIPRISKINPRVLGICIASVYQWIPAMQLCALLRAAGYDGFIVLGGNTVSRLKKELKTEALFRFADAFVTFRGELALLQIYRALSSSGDVDLTSVPQVVWRDGTEIRVNEGLTQVDFDLLPTPDYSDLPVGQYWGTNYLNLLSAAGCYYGKCSFCAIPYGWGEYGQAQTRRAETIYRDMASLYERHGIHRFKFVDEAFRPSVMKRLAQLILEGGLDVEWEAYTRLETCWLDRNFADLVARAGFRKGYFGLEIMPSSRRTTLNKKDSADPRVLLENCSSVGIKVHWFCMFGYPGTGREDADETVAFLIKHAGVTDTADIFPWTFARHTIVPGVEPIIDPRLDWALEYEHTVQAPNSLNPQQVRELAGELEEVIWREVPRFLHPTYRLVSPWRGQ